jgi:hypothetical protein
VKIPPTNLKPDYLERAQAFATRLADRLVSDIQSRSAVPSKAQNGQPIDTIQVSAHE